MHSHKITTLKYFRHDPPGIAKNILLNQIKTYLAAGHPSMFGFTVYSSISQASETGKIPYPCKGEKILGGHAIVAARYDDKMKSKIQVYAEQKQQARSS